MKRYAAVLFVALLAVVGFLAWASPWKSSLPPFHRATVSLLHPRKETVMDLSPGQQESLNKLFSGIPRDRTPMKWMVFGTIKLFDEAGREVLTVDVFSNPEGSGPFRIGEHYFIGYDQKEFREMLGLEELPDSSR